MKTTIKKGDKVKNQYGEIMTVCSVDYEGYVRTYEDFNNLYHPTKIWKV